MKYKVIVRPEAEDDLLESMTNGERLKQEVRAYTNAV